MCSRRKYKQFIWNTDNCAITDTKTICLINNIEDLENINQLNESSLIYVLFDYLKMKKKIKNSSIEIFSHFDFLYDPFIQCPPMRLLTDEEKQKKVLNTWEMEPKILVSDIICRYFGAKKGDVFKTLQKDRIPIIVTYRVVV